MVRAERKLRKGNLGSCAVCFAAMLGILLMPVACMTPDKAIRETDETGTRLATEFWQKQTGRTNTFDLCRPADALTLLIALLAAARGEQGVIFPSIPQVAATGTSNSAYGLSLTGALCVAARNDRKYQKFKEDIFFRALDLDYQQYAFETSFSGMLLGVLTGGAGADQARGASEGAAARKLPDGTAVAARLALDVVSLLNDDWHSTSISGDLTVTVPLMRGAGRDIVREPLTQAERDLANAIRAFVYYRQTYAVSVASGYFRVLELAQRLKNALENERRLEENSKRAEMMFDAGRMQRIQVDQARTDLLKAGESVILSRMNYATGLDVFKMTLGLPPEAPVTVDPEELRRLEKQMEQVAESKKSAAADFPEESDSFRIALASRQDLLITRSLLEDTERGVMLAADALRADVALNVGLATERDRAMGDARFADTDRWTAGIRAGFPWDRRKERNAFKKQLILVEQAKRILEEQEDRVKLDVRSGLRTLVAARSSYENQIEAMKVAQLRVQSNDLFLQSGRSTMRDILEAESAMLDARNALCSSVIQWHISELALRRDMGVLDVSDAGIWPVANGEQHD
ncbi:MAG: TolC family protein [bacterium]